MDERKPEKCVPLNSEEKGSLIVELVIAIPAIVFAFFGLLIRWRKMCLRMLSYCQMQIL